MAHTRSPTAVGRAAARHRSSTAGRSATAGFTLLELMITVAVITILTLIAVPLYLSQVRESRRTDARTAALDMAGREERYYATNNAYTTTAADLGYASLPATVGSGYYSINVSEPNNNNQTFLVTVTPVANTSQAADSTCAQFTVDQLGQQSAQSSGGTDTSSTCWP